MLQNLPLKKELFRVDGLAKNLKVNVRPYLVDGVKSKVEFDLDNCGATFWSVLQPLVLKSVSH